MMRGNQDEGLRARDPLPSWLRKLRAPNWGYVNNIPAWPELYHEVWRVNESRWGDSNTQELRNLDIVNQMWHAFGIVAEPIVRDFRELQWERVSSTDLVLLYEAHLIGEIGIWSLAPAEFSDLGDRRRVFFDTLIRKDILDHTGSSMMRPKLAVQAFIGYCAGPWVQTEMVRREALNIGSHAAILKLCFALAEDNQAGFMFEEALAASQKKLELSIYNNLRPKLVPYPPWQKQDTQEEIPGWIARVLKKESEYKELDPLQALVDGMEGKLNIFPRRVADRIKNSLLKADRHAVKAESCNLDNPKDPENPRWFEKALTIKITNKRERENAQVDDIDLLDTFLRKYPKHKDIAIAIQSDESQKVLAGKLSISERTLSRRLKQFRDDFARFKR